MAKKPTPHRSKKHQAATSAVWFEIPADDIE